MFLRLILFCALIGLMPSPAFAQAQPCRMTVGIQETLDPIFFVETMAPTMAALRKQFPECTVRSKLLSSEGLHAAAGRSEIDFFMADSGIFSFEVRTSGAKDLAVRRGPGTRDPSQAVSSALVVLSERKDLQNVSDLQGKTVAAVNDVSFDGWLIAQAMIADQGYDADRFWGRRLFTEFRDPGVIQLLLSGEVDVGILRACELEELLRRHHYDPDRFRIINRSNTDRIPCACSAPLYPDIVFASLPHNDPEVLKKLIVMLLSEPPSYGGFAWGVAGNFRGIDTIYKTLKLGPYAYLRTFNWKAFWEEYGNLAGAAFFLLVLAFLHYVRVKRLVNIRTRQLRESLEEQRRLEKVARENRQKLSQVERAGVVSLMSAMLAHEVLQPVTSLINFAGGLRIYAKKTFGGDTTVDDITGIITEEARRVSEIVDRVRAYAKGRELRRESVRVTDVIRAAEQTFTHSTTSENVRVTVRADDALFISADRLEMELVLFNLMKNSAVAMAEQSEKPLLITACRQGESAVITVEDRGPRISDRVFSSLSEPITSMKQDGLGLGLSLCKGIMERHGGNLSFTREPTGLRAIVTMPAEPLHLSDQS